MESSLMLTRLRRAIDAASSPAPTLCPSGVSTICAVYAPKVAVWKQAARALEDGGRVSDLRDRATRRADSLSAAIDSGTSAPGSAVELSAWRFVISHIKEIQEQK